MLITAPALAAFNTSFQALYTKGFGTVAPIYNKLASTTKSVGAEEAYGWLGQLPQIREWLGPRHVSSLSTEGFKIQNRKFESTISIKRTDFEDDRVGVLGPLFEDMGMRVAEFPDILLAELISSGFTSVCYDGQYFFDTDHPIDTHSGEPSSASNMQAGAGPTWYLLDLTRPFRPFIFQERIPFTMQRLDRDSDENVFFADEYIYGTRGRCNVGYGLWQLAFASKAELNATNYEAARTAMSTLRGDNDKLLGIRPSTLLVPTTLEGKGRKLLKNLLGEGGESNSWVDSAELLVSPWLD
ncbi:Mu-like prophage major head subunit gpT family protein [soil metagenome]